jgi:hypothetical protein
MVKDEISGRSLHKEPIRGEYGTITWKEGRKEGRKEGLGAYLGLREVWAARSREEYFPEGPKMRVPPCSLPPLAGAQVGRAAVVISLGCLLGADPRKP